MGNKEQPCVVINCGDDHKKKHDCCDPCEATRDGNAYTGGVDIGFITPVAVELPIALLSNPLGSGKNLVVYARHMAVIGSDDENVLTRFYFDPTVTNPGAPAPTVNLNAGGASSAGVLTSVPVVSANGFLVDVFNVSDGETSNTTLVIGEGHSMLVTERANAENTRASSNIYWIECRVREHEHDQEEA